MITLKHPAPRRPFAFAPGRNAWRVDRADLFRCVQDGAEYFRLVREAVLAAERTIFMLGWDIAGATDLLPGESPVDGPTRFDELLSFVASRRPKLECFILIWDYGALYTLERDPFSRWRLGWRTPRRVKFGFDDHHPLGACHHQKILVVDDRLAFSGSMDVTAHRWDTSAHRLVEPARTSPRSGPYPPYHEVQALVEGPVAASLGELARDRWRALGARRMPPLAPARRSLWPRDVDADFTAVDVAISRTVPGTATDPAVRECEALFFDTIESAERSIYIENQYFTNPKIAQALAARLAEPGGPEVIVVSPQQCEGWLERNTMGAFREDAFRILTNADRNRRLRLVYPLASRAEGVPTFVHSKVMIVDDELLRIGSANCSNRSMGVDTECDLAVAAEGEREIQAGIVRVRNRLLGEHLGLEADAVSRELDRAGSIRALIDRTAGQDRCLAAIDLQPPSDAAAVPTEVIRSAADPDEPLALGTGADGVLPAIEATQAASPLRLWILPITALLAAGIVAWSATDPSTPIDLSQVRSSLVALPDGRLSLLAGTAVFMVAAGLLVPIELLVLCAGFLFGPVRGGLVGLCGALGAAVAGYAVGRAMGPGRLMRWMNPRAYRIGRQLRATRPAAIAALHLGMTSARSAHLLLGAAKAPLASYLAGAAIGLLLPVAALSGLGGLLRMTMLESTVGNALLTIGAALLLVGAAFALRTFLLIRQFAPSISAQRSRAEFG